MDEVLATFEVPLDSRFSTIRTSETNVGNLVCDAILSSVLVHCAIVNSGTLRSDELLPAGPFRRRHLRRLIPIDPLELSVIAISGERLLAALESAVSVWPKHEGRFPQVAGLTFEFVGDAAPGARVRHASVRVGDQPLQLDRVRTCMYLCTVYMYSTVLITLSLAI